MKFSLLLVVLAVAGCATAKFPNSGGDDDNTQQPDSGVVRRFDAGVILPDSGSQQLPDSGSQQLPDSGTVLTPDASTGGCNPPGGGGTCDTSPQCGCPGQNCSVTNFTSGATSCVAPGSTNDFALCTGNGVGQCKVGSTCVDGVCSPYCETPADCPGANRDCTQVSGSTGTAVPGFKVCTQFCNPLSPTSNASPYMACGSGATCFPDTSGVSSCYGPTTAAGTQDEYCDTGVGTDGDPTLCAPGYACVGDTLFGFNCDKFCKVVGGNCSAGYTCSSFSTPQYAGTTEIGFCN